MNFYGNSLEFQQFSNFFGFRNRNCRICQKIVSEKLDKSSGKKRLKSKNQKKSFLTRSQKKPSQEDFIVESEGEIRVLDKLVNAECAVVPQICLRGYFTTEASWMDIDVDPLTDRSESRQRKLLLFSRIVLRCSSYFNFGFLPRNTSLQPFQLRRGRVIVCPLKVDTIGWLYNRTELVYELNNNLYVL